MGNIYIGRISLRQFVITLATGAVIVTVAGGMKALGALIVTAFIIYGLGRYFRHHLGGQTGIPSVLLKSAGKSSFCSHCSGCRRDEHQPLYLVRHGKPPETKTVCSTAARIYR